MRLSHVVLLVTALWAVTVSSSLAGSAIEPLSVKAPEISIPPGTKPGTLRRIIQPFDQWTLICDENLKTRTRVCNVSQTLVDPRGRTVFSWSLAAGDNGAPLFVVRLPTELAGDHFVQIIFGGKTPTQSGVILSNCSAAICLGYLEVDSKIKHEIGAKAPIQIKVRLGQHVETFATTLAGLGPAVASLK